MVYKRMTRSGMCKLSQQWEMLYRQPSNGDKSDVFFCPFTVQHILYLCNFPAQITLLVRVSNIGYTQSAARKSREGWRFAKQIRPDLD